jgi:hypothetical protein
MYRTDYQNQHAATRHQQRMWQYARQYRLAEIARGRKQSAWIGALVQALVALFR